MHRLILNIMNGQIKKLNCTTRQKHILQIMHEYDEGWICEKTLEENLGKLFLDKRHRPKNGE